MAWRNPQWARSWNLNADYPVQMAIRPHVKRVFLSHPFSKPIPGIKLFTSLAVIASNSTVKSRVLTV